MTYSNGDKYEGEWLDDEFKGKGVYKFKNENIYEGLFFNDIKHF